LVSLVFVALRVLSGFRLPAEAEIERLLYELCDLMEEKIKKIVGLEGIGWRLAIRGETLAIDTLTQRML